MRRFFFVLGVIVTALSLSACKRASTTETEHNSRNSLDWAGIYRVSIPTGENQEKIIVVTLDSALTYRLQTVFTGEWDQATDTRGTFSWNDRGSEITLKDASGKEITFQVGENRLIEQGNGNVLLKQERERITEKYWKLTEINGQPIAGKGEMQREPFIILKEQDNRLSGSGGCNTLIGTYELDEATNRISFSHVGATMMACPDMEVETQLLKILEMTDNFSLSADGTQLSLNRARMAPLARFEVVYLR